MRSGTVDSELLVRNKFSSLAFGPGGQPAISYIHGKLSHPFSETFDFLEFASFDGSNWSSIAVESYVEHLGSSSLAFGPDGSRAISYDMANYLGYGGLQFVRSGGLDLDFGDAPDLTYPTLEANDGARHILGVGPFLGNDVNAETDGQPSENADADDTNGLSDEDGVVFTNALVQGSNGCVEITASGPGLLDAWIDFDGSGTWDDFEGEQIFTNQTLSSGVNTGLCFAVPFAPTIGPTYARFRFSQAGGLSPTGLAADGEVEDYAVMLLQYGTKTNFAIRDTILTSSNGIFSITWDTETNVMYQLQSTRDLSEQPSQVWSNVGDPVLGPIKFQIGSSNSPTQVYYRVTVPFLFLP